MFRQLVLCFAPGTVDPEMEADLRAQAPRDGTPIRVQENIVLAPATGGPAWMSIDVVLPIAEATAAGVLSAAVLLSVKSIVVIVRRRFPGVRIRLLSDRYPSVTYEPPADSELSQAIEAIPADYIRQSRTEFAFKRWLRDRGWQVKFSRASVIAAANEAGGAVTIGSSRRRGRRDVPAKKRTAARDMSTSAIQSRVKDLEDRVRSGVKLRSMALSEIDKAIADYGPLARIAHTRAERRLIDSSQKRALSLRASEAKRLLARWGGELRIHEGIDLAVPEGTAVLAARPGLVVEVGIDGYGAHAVKLRSRDIDIILGHLREAAVVVGQEVEKGEIVGYSGSEGGQSSGPHLHFEVRPAGAEYGDTLDPTPFFEADDAGPPSESYGNELDL
jgi:murein DD-endopeptidase MepM/ murein hydrolase activator NlpD